MQKIVPIFIRSIFKAIIRGTFLINSYTYLLNLIDHFNDLKRGIKTEEVLGYKDLAIDPLVGIRYESTRYKKLKSICNIAYSRGYSSFLDIGCGYGRPLIVASEIGFSTLFGVDISQKLIKGCIQNLNKLNISAKISCCDIFDYRLPDRDLVIFLFNPIREDRLSSLINEITKRNNQYLVIYHNPVYSYCFPEKPTYKILDKHYGLYDEITYFYEFLKA